MSDKFTFSSAGLVHEIEMAMDRVGGWNSALVKKLSTGENLSIVREFLLGQISFKPISEDHSRFITINETTITVNLGASPNLPFSGAEVAEHVGEGWVIVEKRLDGLYINGRKVVLHLSKRQKDGKRLKGHELREELTGKPVLNANILDALYQNPHLIPEEWKKDENGNIRYIFFWGTIYRDSGSGLCVRYLCFDVGVWCRSYGWFDGGWGGRYPAVLLAQPTP
ncbi:MAG: hypothetical protein AAB522_02430 [Patescibacteria group bacterium]